MIDRLSKAVGLRLASVRERRLLGALACFAAATFAASARDGLATAGMDHAAARDRLDRLTRQYAELSGTGLQAGLAAQKLQLSRLSISDQTAQISQLRMREELEELASRAELTDIAIVENAGDAGAELVSNTAAGSFTAIEASLEADFSQAGLTRFLRQLAEHYRAYQVTGIEIRATKAPARMVLRLRVLHKRPGGAS